MHGAVGRSKSDALSGAVSLGVPVFAGTLSVSALLLFAVQPMFTKMVMPVLGGSPSVWSVAMVFFQVLLLAGYVCAHPLPPPAPGRSRPCRGACSSPRSRRCPSRSLGGGPPPEQGPALWLIWVFTLSVGLPFFAVSAHGPLLQAWFARTGHPSEGSLLPLRRVQHRLAAALIAYPFVVEPFPGLAGQSAALVDRLRPARRADRPHRPRRHVMAAGSRRRSEPSSDGAARGRPFSARHFCPRARVDRARLRAFGTARLRHLAHLDRHRERRRSCGSCRSASIS